MVLQIQTIVHTFVLNVVQNFSTQTLLSIRSRLSQLVQILKKDILRNKMHLFRLWQYLVFWEKGCVTTERKKLYDDAEECMCWLLSLLYAISLFRKRVSL